MIPAISAASQTMMVASTQVQAPSMFMPSENTSVMMRPTKVVTSAVPPMRALTCFRAIFTISGWRMAVMTVKISTAMRNAAPETDILSRTRLATHRPIAAAAQPRTRRMSIRVMGRQ